MNMNDININGSVSYAAELAWKTGNNSLRQQRRRKYGKMFTTYGGFGKLMGVSENLWGFRKKKPFFR